MGHSSVVAYPVDSSLTANEGQAIHPNREMSADELVDHIVRVHHAVVRQSLADSANRLPTISVASSTRDDHWDKIIRQFSELHDATLTGLRYEESVVFPQLLAWQATCQEQSPPRELLAAAKTVARSHAICLQMLWRLLRLTRDELTGTLGARHQRQFTRQSADMLFDQLSALCDDYERHLFEVECLLLPIVTSRSTSNRNHSATASVHASISSQRG